MSFLPKNYERKSSGGGFLKLEAGDNRVRVLSEPVIGMELWVGGNPVRKPFGVEFIKEELANADINTFDGTKRKPTEFWGVVVWDYKSQSATQYNFTQRGIIDGLLDLLEDADWGDVREYDINIKKVTGERTKYSVSPVPPKPLSDEIKKAYEESTIDLSKLFSSTDDLVKVDVEEANTGVDDSPEI